MWKIWLWSNRFMYRFLLLAVLLCFGLNGKVSAQQNDFHSWYNFTLGGKISKKLEFTLEPELRLYNNSRQVRNWQTEGSIEYDWTKLLNVGGVYRYQVEYDNANYNERIHRFAIFVKLNHKLNKLRFRYRGMLQNEHYNWMTSSDGKINYMGHRHKVSVKYSKKKLLIKPSVGVEVYLPIQPAIDRGEWKMRYFVTCEHNVSKEVGLKVSYKQQHEYNVSNPDIINILMFGLEFKPKFIN